MLPPNKMSSHVQRTVVSLITLAIVLLGCSNIPVKMDVDIVYKKDLRFCVRDVGCYEGVGVVPRLTEYHLEVSPTEEDQIDRIVFNSCHRNKGFYPEDDDLISLPFFNKWWKDIFGKEDERKGFLYPYYPSPGLEDKASCPLYIFILDSKSESHAWAVMIPEDPKYQLHATLYCDGQTNIYKGVSACEGRMDTIQRIKFLEPVHAFVRAVRMPEHQVQSEYTLPKKVGEFYEWTLGKGACAHLFRTKENKAHSLITWGYQGLRFKKDKLP